MGRRLNVALEKPSITIVGCGPGSLDYVTPAAIRAVESADVLVGTKRLLDLFPASPAERIDIGSAVRQIVEKIEEIPADRRIAVLVTGDPGLFSLAAMVIRRFGRHSCRVIPGISSVQTAFARIGLNWTDARIVSAHKDDPEIDPSLKSAEKIAVLGGRKTSMKWIADTLLKGDASDRSVFVMEDLTLETERIREIEPGDLASLEAVSRAVVLIVRKSALP
jgi:cobalt-precorrin-7 (C5)-methyltransferase